MMFGPKEFCMIPPVIMFQACCIYYFYCNRGMYYYHGSNVIKKIKDLIEKIWSEFWRNRIKCLEVVFQLSMVALTSFLLKDTHTWTAIWIASSAIFAILYSSYKACVKMKRAQLMPPVNRRYYRVLGYQVIPIHIIYNVASHWNPRGVVIDTLLIVVGNEDVVVPNVAEVLQDLGIQSVPQANAPEVTVQRDGRNQSVADTSVPEVAIQRDLEDQFVAHPPEVAKNNDGGTESIANANVPEIAVQRDVDDQSAAGEPEVPQKDDEENQSVDNEYATEIVIQKYVEDQSESDAGPSEVAHKDEEYHDLHMQM
ncbi:uncharacterized protein LOC108202896 [Daucus carota subsp. sativus]|nr:PREDICTED: uncharacterized protein LOC108202896 [Daucus carota subsp. sativus]